MYGRTRLCMTNMKMYDTTQTNAHNSELRYQMKMYDTQRRQTNMMANEMHKTKSEMWYDTQNLAPHLWTA